MADLAMITTALEPMRAEADHRSEQVSEVRGGEWLTVLDRDGDWAHVESEDGYRGWVATWSLQDQSPADREALLTRRVGRYALPIGTLWESDHYAQQPLLLGQPLLRPVDGARERGDWVLVSTVSGAEGWLPRDQINGDPKTVSVDRVLRTGRQLLGTPYRWGGRTAGGLDCSGFVQLVWSLTGVALPRDSSQQAAVGQRVSRSTWEVGDLLFFDDPATHVGILAPKQHLLHARARVRLDRLDEIGDLMDRLSGVRRVLDELPEARSLWGRPAGG